MSYNNTLQATAKSGALTKRVCRAWHESGRVKFPTSGIRRSEGWEKDKGVIARRGLEETQSKAAG